MGSDGTAQAGSGGAASQSRWRRLGNWTYVVVSFVAGLLVATAAGINALDRIMIGLKLAPDALQLQREDARSKFSRDLVRAAWGRWFLMQRYISAIEIELPAEERARLWQRYLDARDEWNRDLMVNILSLDQFYDVDKRNLFEGPIQTAFGSLHTCLASLHYDRPQVVCPISPARDLNAIKARHERLNFLLYCFATGLSEKTRAITDCRSLVD